MPHRATSASRRSAGKLPARTILTSPRSTATSVEGGTLGNHCLGWSSGLAGSYGIVGSISAKDESWTNADLQPCNVKLRLYCVEDP